MVSNWTPGNFLSFHKLYSIYNVYIVYIEYIVLLILVITKNKVPSSHLVMIQCFQCLREGTFIFLHKVPKVPSSYRVERGGQPLTPKLWTVSTLYIYRLSFPIYPTGLYCMGGFSMVVRAKLYLYLF